MGIYAWHVIDNTSDLGKLPSLFIFRLIFFHLKTYRDSYDGKCTGHQLLNRYSVMSSIGLVKVFAVRYIGHRHEKG